MAVNWTIIGSVLVPVIVAFIAYIISPHLSYKRELKRIYDAPFRRDIAFFYGELWEFYKRYIEPLAQNQALNVSPVQIVDDFRSLHESQVELPKWFGKIKQEFQDQKVVEGIWNVIDVVDRLWHNIESDSQFRIRTRFTSRDDILRMEPEAREKMANNLINQLTDEIKGEKGRLKNTEEVLKRLRQKIR